MLSEYTEAIKKSGVALKYVFNPYESDINLYPGNKTRLKQSLAKKIHFPLPELIPDSILAYLGSRILTPGRLYSFFGRKQRGH